MKCLHSSRCGFGLALLVLLSGCSTPLAPPDLQGLYSQAAQYHGPERNPVIVLPGILGSRLIQESDGMAVWGAFGGDGAKPSSVEGSQLLAIPMEIGQPLSALKDNVVSSAALDRVDLNLFGLPISLQAYAQIMAALGAGGYQDQQLAEAGAIDYGDDHFTCFQFHYDWRLDNAENAQRLHKFMLEKKAFVEAEYTKRFGPGHDEVKFDIVAHSMGGLVTRYMLRYGNQALPENGSLPHLNWSGADLVDKVVLVGTPSAGSLLGFTQTLEGFSLGPLGKFSACVLGTLPSIYQLMPRSRHEAIVYKDDPSRVVSDVFDPILWEKMGWSLANPEEAEMLEILLPEVESAEERRAIAIDHMTKCLKRAEQFQRALDFPSRKPSGLQLKLVAGDAKATPAVVAVGSGRDYVFSQWGPGDGTVLRTSALMDERVGGAWRPYLDTPIDWSEVTFLFADHLGLTKDPIFVDNLLFYLLETR